MSPSFINVGNFIAFAFRNPDSCSSWGRIGNICRRSTPLSRHILPKEVCLYYITVMGRWPLGSHKKCENTTK